jgi:hypothetical protein
MPATSAADERSFSALKRLKKLKNSQSQDRLSSLALINIENPFLKKTTVQTQLSR